VSLSPPLSIAAADDLSQFDCGEELLNDWLRRLALKSEGASARTYVVKEQERVVGYYCLATGGVARSNVPNRMRHGLPDPVPVMVLGRLAVDKHSQGRGIGRGLLKDALLRTLQVSEQVGVRALLVHAIDDAARSFYAAYGFREFPLGSRTLFLPLESAARAL
jgi:GNAT superfamily N-acetyltransferase